VEAKQYYILLKGSM